jgi:hypothetical protein
MFLAESNQSGQTPTNLVTHPSGIGYRRSSPGVTTWSGSTSSTTPAIPGNAPTMDSGTTDGGPDQELNRLANFLNGGNENPTSTQPGPTPRAQQLGMPMLPIASPAAVNISSGLSPTDDAAMNQTGPMGANLNNPMNVGGATGYGLLADLGLVPPLGAGAGGGGAGAKAGKASPTGGPAGGRMYPRGNGAGGGGMTGPDGLVPDPGGAQTMNKPRAPQTPPPLDAPPQTGAGPKVRGMTPGNDVVEPKSNRQPNTQQMAQYLLGCTMVTGCVASGPLAPILFVKGLDEIGAAIGGTETATYEAARSAGLSDAAARAIDLATSAPELPMAIHKGLVKTAASAGPRSGLLFSAEKAAGNAAVNIGGEAAAAMAKNPARTAAVAAKLGRGSVEAMDVAQAAKLLPSNPVNGEIALYHGSSQAATDSLRAGGISSAGLDDGLFNVSINPSTAVKYANRWGGPSPSVAVIKIPYNVFLDLFKKEMIKPHDVLIGGYQITPEGQAVINKLLGH